MDQALLSLVNCPRCGGELRASGKQSECSGCGTAFPSVAGIPVLFPDPARVINDWRREAQRFVELLEQSVAATDEQLQRGDLLPSTRRRLERTRAASADNGQRIAQLFSAAGLAPDSKAKASQREFSLIEYYDHILRDWAWADEQHPENAQAADLVAASIGPDRALGRLLVLGAGPARLAYDLHTRFVPSLTVALDINPLLVLAARQVIFGDGQGGAPGLELWEFPTDPRHLELSCVDRRLRPPAAPPQNFHLLLADAFASPLRPAAFDTVVTPWFIDIVPTDIRESISLVHRLLAPGGRWLHYGPLSYPKEHSHAQRYSREELQELVALADLQVGPVHTRDIGFMNSPASARSKSVEVMSFAARKPAAPSPQPVDLPADKAPPAWLLMSHLPIPRWTGLAAYKPDHPLLAYLTGLIDGQRTLGDLAQSMIKDHGARPEAALTGTRAMLALVVNATHPA